MCGIKESLNTDLHVHLLVQKILQTLRPAVRVYTNNGPAENTSDLRGAVLPQAIPALIQKISSFCSQLIKWLQ